MPETESPEPSEESSSPETDAPEVPSDLPAGATHASARPGRIRQILMGCVLVLLLLGLWFDMKARRECDRATEELMYLLQPFDFVTTNKVREIAQRAPKIHELRSRYGGLNQEYVWKGVFNTYHMQVNYTWNFNRYEMDGVRSYSRRRWDRNQTSPAVEDQRPELAQQFMVEGVEREIRRNLKKPEGELTTADFRSIKRINLAGKQITDLLFVHRMSEIENLNLSDNKLTDVADLGGLTQLEVLQLNFNRLKNLDALADMRTLRVLDAGHNLLADTAAFAQLRQLSRLTLRHNLITDLAPLSQLRQLQFLDLNHNHLSDLGPLGGMHELDILRLSENKIKNLEPLAGLPNLGVLYLATNQVTDIRPLAAIATLQRLYLAGNQITDVAELAKLKKLYQLDLTGNPVPISKVEELRKSLPRCEIKF